MGGWRETRKTGPWMNPGSTRRDFEDADGLGVPEGAMPMLGVAVSVDGLLRIGTKARKTVVFPIGGFGFVVR